MRVQSQTRLHSALVRSPCRPRSATSTPPARAPSTSTCAREPPLASRALAERERARARPPRSCPARRAPGRGAAEYATASLYVAARSARRGLRAATHCGPSRGRSRNASRATNRLAVGGDESWRTRTRATRRNTRRLRLLKSRAPCSLSSLRTRASSRAHPWHWSSSSVDREQDEDWASCYEPDLRPRPLRSRAALPSPLSWARRSSRPAGRSLISPPGRLSCLLLPHPRSRPMR